MPLVAATVLTDGGPPWPATAGLPTFAFPGLVEWEGPAEDDEGTCYATITNELAHELVQAEEDGSSETSGWVAAGDAYWLCVGTWRVGIRPEDVQA